MQVTQNHASQESPTVETSSEIELTVRGRSFRLACHTRRAKSSDGTPMDGRLRGVVVVVVCDVALIEGQEEEVKISFSVHPLKMESLDSAIWAKR